MSPTIEELKQADRLLELLNQQGVKPVMNANEIPVNLQSWPNEVVNTLADRLGIAVEKLVPVAETLVREVVVRNWAHAGLFLVAFVIVSCLGLYCYRSGRALKWDFDDDDHRDHRDHRAQVAGSAVGLGLAIVVAFLLFTIEVAPAVVRALSPTFTLLENLK